MMNLIENFPFSGGLIGLGRFETFTASPSPAAVVAAVGGNQVLIGKNAAPTYNGQ